MVCIADEILTRPSPAGTILLSWSHKNLSASSQVSECHFHHLITFLGDRLRPTRSEERRANRGAHPAEVEGTLPKELAAALQLLEVLCPVISR